jgi:hypothetical protein
VGGIQRLRAALIRVSGSSLLSPDGAARLEVKLSQETVSVFAPKVRELIEQVCAAQYQHAGAVVEEQAAKDVLRRADEELTRLEAAIEEREKSLPRDGAPMPEEAMPEEAQATSLVRQRRVMAARAGLCGERVAAAAAEVEKLKTSLDVEFLQFGEAEYLKLREEFHAAAKELRRVYSRLAPWPALFWGRGTVPLPPLPTLIIEDPLTRTIQGRFIIDSRQENWDQVGDAELFATLRSLRAEVDAAKSNGGEGIDGSSSGTSEHGEAVC